MTKEDWDCPLEGHYVRKAMCAMILEGTPNDYLPALKNVDGSPEVDCDNPPDLTEDIYNSSLPLYQGCDKCRICSIQISQTDGVAGQWDELSNCPDSLLSQEYGELCGLESPTTGEEPTTTEDPIEMGTGVWICNGSPTIKAYMDDGIPPYNNGIVTQMSPNGEPDCVTADSEFNARDMCEKLCNCKNTGFIHLAADTGKHWTGFPCQDLYNYAIPPVEAENLSMCHGGGSMWPLPNEVDCENLFSGIAELEIVGGGIAETEELVGFMDYAIAPCLPGASCDVTVNKIHAWTSTVNGVYSVQDASGAWSSVPFVINDLEARTLQPFVGQLNPSTGIVTFAGEELFATASTGAVLLDGTGLSTGLTDAAYVVESISGSVVSGELTLELEWSSPSGDVSLYLQLSSQ